MQHLQRPRWPADGYSVATITLEAPMTATDQNERTKITVVSDFI